jgi:FHS family L-fucose permease-like MFS transporter
MSKKNNYLTALLIIGLLFFIFGFITWVNGTLITFFKKAFQLDNTGSYLVTFASYISYTVMAIPSSMVLRKTGFKNGLSLGLLIMALGSLLFIPAANMASYPLFLVGLFTSGIGLTVLQTAANPYVTILGPRESAAQRISFMGIANKTAGICSQILFGTLLLSGVTSDNPADELQKVVTPYLVLFGVFVVLAILIWVSKGLPDINEEDTDDSASSSTVTGVIRTSVFQFPNLVIGVVALFCAGGVEVIAVDTIINYGISLDFAEDTARVFGSYSLAAMMLGYLMGTILIPKFISQENYLKVSSLIGIVLTVLAVVTSDYASVLFVAAMGFANAIMWPAIWPLALRGLGKFTNIGAAMLIMSICGGAIFPLVYGGLADAMNDTRSAYWIMVPLYLFILYFSTKGHKKDNW